MGRAGVSLFAVVAVALGACGGGSSSGGSSGTCNPSSAASMTLSSSGVTPKAVCVVPGGTVTFRNSDTVQHDIQGDTAACAVLNTGGIDPNTSKSVTLQTTQTCGFHDGDSANAAFDGTVAVTSAPATGPGY
jgi:plastocyanin